MAAGKEIRQKIESVKSTQKITKAMQLVASAKMQKTQQKMLQSRPYSAKICEIIAKIAPLLPNYFAKNTNTTTKGIIIIMPDKGLCGSLNSNINKVFAGAITVNPADTIVCALGYKAVLAATKKQTSIISSAVALGDTPQLEQLIGPASAMLHELFANNISSIDVVYTKFINNMQQQAICERLFPITLTQAAPTDYLYEPAAEIVVQGLLKRYFEALIYHCVAESMASEQVARMIAMRSATENADSAIATLSLAYNKARQDMITKELAEICGGAAAV